MSYSWETPPEDETDSDEEADNLPGPSSTTRKQAPKHKTKPKH